jgi:hypothetical protein
MRPLPPQGSAGVAAGFPEWPRDGLDCGFAATRRVFGRMAARAIFSRRGHVLGTAGSVRAERHRRGPCCRLEAALAAERRLDKLARHFADPELLTDRLDKPWTPF